MLLLAWRVTAADVIEQAGMEARRICVSFVCVVPPVCQSLKEFDCKERENEMLLVRKRREHNRRLSA